VKSLRKWLLIVSALAVSTLAFDGYQFAIVGSAYVAHMLCSGVFVSGRTQESVIASDLTADDLAPLRYVRVRVDTERRRVTTSVFGVAARTAIYRDSLGCTLSDDDRSMSNVVWYFGSDTFPKAADARSTERQRQLADVLDWAFAEPDPSRLRRTRAVVVLQDGRLLAERYAEGFTKDTPLIGWSMAKSVVNALVGILVGKGAMSLDSPLPIDAWPAGDPRRAITLDQFLRMSSGLDFDEDSINPRGGVLFMLLRAPDVPAYAAMSPLAAAPGTRWRYSSATTNVITGAMRRVMGDAFLAFPRRALFDPIGMHSAVLETDARGNFIGSSFMWATARDWARFGQLYLDDGVWDGERILPEGWVKYSRTPAPAAPDRRYGAHFWLKIADAYRRASPSFALPADAFHAVGHEGQFVTIIPSRRLVVVRLGLTRRAGAWAHDEFVARVLHALADDRLTE
jgi:hypothetical protein